MLQSSLVVPFVATINPAASLAFYRDVLGLEVLEDTPFALVLRTGSGTMRVAKVESFVPQPFTVVDFQVMDIVAVRNALSARRVEFVRYPGMPQDDLGIMEFPGGAKVCWFLDPDGNVLSLSWQPSRL